MLWFLDTLTITMLTVPAIAPCGELQTAGYDGVIAPDKCPFLPSLVADVCECVTNSKPVAVDCAAIAAGNATTDAPLVSFDVGMSLTISNDYDFAEVAAALKEMLQSRVAPRVAGCPPQGEIAGRSLQESGSGTQIVNVLFFAPEQATGRESHRVCLKIK